jgi:deoxyribonuclease-4
MHVVWVAHAKMIARGRRAALLDAVLDGRASAMRIGAHVPTEGGLAEALDYALETGCEALQLFAKSPRRWSAPRRDPEEAAAFRAACVAAGVGPAFTHASYLINLGASDPLQWEKSCAALADEMMRAFEIGAAGVVVHLGTRFCDDDAGCTARVAETVRRAADYATAPVAPVLLENAAGAGRQYGTNAHEMANALLAVRASGVAAGLCVDTCHAFAAGIDLRGAEGWSGLLSHIDAHCGPGAIALVHANDCKGEFGSHRDRHEWIGEGFLGEPAFEAMFAHPSLVPAVAIVEMPGEPPEKDSENVSRLKRLRAAAEASGGPVPAPA